MTDTYRQFTTRLEQLHRLGGAMALLGWDQEVTMPAGGARSRAGHRAALAEVIHQKLVDPALGGLLDDLEGYAGLDAAAAANVRESRRLRDRAVRLPTELVRDQAEAATLAHGEWVQARRNDDWDGFAPHLARLVDLKRREAIALAVGDEPYDSLLDDHEPGARTADLLPVFAQLRAALTDLLGQIGDRLQDPVTPLRGRFSEPDQDRLCRDVLALIGYDFNGGRLDLSTHPFTESMGRGDVRITTRLDPDNPLSGLYSTLHEGGHALYEQGLPAAHATLPAGRPVSLGIHESQSRLWENFVGRSLPFCRWLAPRLRNVFPAAMTDLADERLYRLVNRVAATPIRVEADEVTYNLHIILRLEIERLLIAGDLPARDVAAVWREKAREYLGLAIADDRTGALQDIHWCTGAFGYFPTYTLGNLYGAMFWQAARRELPDLDDLIAAGRCEPLLAWLRAQIHTRGSILTAGDLCHAVTGSALTPGPFIAYLQDKYGALADC
jgi:carboxypeptidase Taq